MSLEDDGKFQCQVGAAEGVAPIRSKYATVTVLVPPEPPVITTRGGNRKHDSEAATEEGREVELRCESRGGKPASEVSTRLYFGDLKLTPSRSDGLRRPALT